jgi:hypothetical protein
MSNTNITFSVDAGDKVNVKVICSKNSCKNLDADDAEDGSPVNDRKCYVNVSGTNYGGEDLKLNPDGNVIEFELEGAEGGSIFTFQKYSGTGDILISSIEITPIACIAFADSKVKEICVANWDTNGDGELNISEAAAVTNLGQVFKGNTQITLFDELKFFTGLTSIGSRTFYNCSGLTSVTIPNSVTIIDRNAFEYCSRLTTITIPNSLTSIEKYVFSHCTSLTSIEIPNSVTSIEENALAYCTSLTSVIIPNSVTSIGQSAFSGCSGLTSVEIGNSVTSIGIGAFFDCSSLTSIKIGNSVTSIGGDAFYGCSSLTSVTIPNSVKSIEGGAFEGCSNLASITIGNSVTSIGPSAFYGCISLNSVEIPNSVKSIEMSAFQNCSGMNSVTIGNGLTSIDREVFRNCSGLTSITIPNSVTSIGSGAFMDCSSLTSVTIPNSVTIVGEATFYGTGWYNNQNDGLLYLDYWLLGYKGYEPVGKLTIAEGTKGIAALAFYNCTGLTSVKIPNSVTSIINNAFLECSGLTSVTMENKNPITIDSNTFSNRNNATLYVPAGAKSAYVAANYWKEFKEIVEIVPPSPAIEFADANVKAICVANWDTNGDGELSEAEAAAVKSLEGLFGNISITTFDELKYFTGLQTINSSDFNGCESLTSITIPSSITLIESMAFESCKSLTAVHITDLGAWCKIYFENNPLWYAKHLFLNGTEIKDLMIPDGVTSISGWAFSFWNNLTSVTIPKSVTFIGENAFDGCDDLTTVSIDNNVLEIEKEAFQNCNNLTSFHITDIASWCESQIAPYGNPLRNTHSLYVNDKEVKELVIPEGVTSINLGVFDGYSALVSVTIPSSVNNIGMGAFNGCTNLLDIYSLAETTPSIEDDPCFKTQTATLHVPNTSLEAYKTADYWKEFKFIVGLDDIVTESDCIYSDGLSIYQGYTANLEVKLVNEKTFTAYQFDLVLPEGISLATDENGKYLVAKSDRYSDKSQQVKVEKHDNNTYRIMSLSMQNGIINGNDGVILTIILKADEEIAVGNIKAEIRDVVLTVPDETKIKTKPVTFSIEVERRMKGDADGDGEIDVTDIVAMINYIMGQPSANFVMPAADMNEDGEVDIFDVMIAINLVMSQKKSARTMVRAISDTAEQTTMAVTNNGVKFGINDSARFTAFQFDVEVAEGMELTEACLIAITTNHKLRFVKTDQNTYRVMGVSMDNSLLKTYENDLVELLFSKSGLVQINDIIFVTPQETKVCFASGDAIVTGIGGIECNQQTEKIFDISGRMVDVDNSRLPKGIFIINNKKVIIK